MTSFKRKFGGQSLQRRVRPRVEEESGEDVRDSSEAPSEEGFESERDADTSSNSPEEEEEGSDALFEEDAPGALDASQLSFGALARAQAAVSSGANGKATQKTVLPGKDEARPARSSKSSGSTKTAKRASKHAPQEMSSKRPVSRKRGIIAAPNAQARDPRFDPLGAPAGGLSRLDEVKMQKAYAFLDEYREDEMRQLRVAIKKTKDPAQKDELRRSLLSMESKKRERERREREQTVIDEHRRKEKELVKQGKKPFYLKKSEQKKRVLLDKFATMKKGQVDKAIERRRKKTAAKERREMPTARRGYDEQ